MLYFNKWFKLPGPKDLGMSDSNNAMPSKFFRNNKTEFTWEDYDSYLQKHYPVKFFFASTLPTFFRYCWMDFSHPFKDAHYWLVSHTIRQYHWLDLRQPKRGIVNIDCYRYGWNDTDSLMVYALMNLLCKFVENEVPTGYYVPSEEAVAKDDSSCLKRQLDDYKEFMAIYNWWKKDRLVENAEYDRKLTEWSNAKHSWAPETKELFKELDEIETRNKNKLDDMLHRLISIRGCLWT